MQANPTPSAFPLNDLQLAYWIGRRNVLEWGNVPTHFYFELDGQVEPRRLEQAMRQAIANHGMMRARFLENAGQQILERVPFDLRVDDLTALSHVDVEHQLAATRERMSHSSPLRDAASPPYELVLSRMREGRTRLHLNLDMLVFDMVSMRILLGELGASYEGRAPAPAVTDFDFQKYLELERAAEAADNVQQALRYWSQRCADLPPGPKLPLAVPANGPAIQAPRMAVRKHRLPASRWAALRKRCAEHGLTPSCVLGAAYAEVLARWSASPRMTLNLTQARRSEHHPAVAGMIGEFTNTILLGLDGSQGATFADRAFQFAERLWTDIAHADVSGIRVRREMARRAGQPVDMPVVFTCALEDLQAPSRWAGEIVHMICETSQVALDNMVIGVGDAPIILWSSVDEYFAPGVVEDMFSAYCALLGRLADDPATWSERRPVGLPGRMHEVRARANAGSATRLGDDGELLHTLPRKHLRAWSDRPAVITAQRTLSYGELFGAAARLGAQLRRKGAAREMLVAIVMEKGWEQILSALAIHEAGAAYLPIDPSWPTDRVHWLLNNARVSIVLTQRDVEARLPWPASVERIIVDPGTLEGARGHEPLAPVQQPSDLAYVIYTSGSTGEPKGVMIEHGSAVNTVLDMNRRFGVGPDDRVLALSNMSFDLSVYDVFGLLAAGGALVIPEPEALRDPARWAELIRRHTVTLWNSVPQLMQMLVDSHPGTQLASACPSIRVALLSGDWIPLALPRRLEGIDAISLGGATEASIWSIWHRIDHIDPAWRSVPYGAPLEHQTWFVLDEALDDQPDWVAGQLYIGGIGLARGYWGDEAKTRASFITHPRTGERLYRTGDLGLYMGGATIEFLGRQDAQVKLQGYRVELGEIEHCARSHPEVDECCVVVRDVRGAGRAAPDQKRGVEHKFLVAYVVPKAGMRPADQELRAHLRAKLPEYMVPARIMLLDRLPLSSNGKIDRSALPEVDAEVASAAALTEETTPTERAVTALWSKLLGLAVEQIPPHMNFFDLGGNSLLLIALANELRDQLQREVPLAQLFQRTSVHALAAHLDEQASPATAEPATDEQARRASALERQRQLRARGRERRDDS